ncbi:uncharacterized protein AB675_7303 [Cyphellophora attinorum]|uniref:PhoD-like phosphatase domain-containing protein n=1 Tax=Cyphellophora attinorum TaxID=1664694 RepID=A0A0N1H3Q3_9EURO|nr:uncharacterized protein AB675_7303 [Phialophora attinorum]KPI36366.1 hypothetical protein AB675_7303 [Phialophora attinorum]
MAATTMNPGDLYHDPSLDGLVQPHSDPRYNGPVDDGMSRPSRRTSHPDSRSRRVSGQVFDSADFMPFAPEVPRGPPNAYRDAGAAEPVVAGPPPQRSFSQRAKGRPFAKEAFEDVDSDGRYPARGSSQQPGPMPTDMNTSRRAVQPPSQPQTVERIAKPYESPARPPTQQDAGIANSQASPRDGLRVVTNDLQDSSRPQKRQTAQSAVEPRTQQQSARRPPMQEPMSARSTQRPDQQVPLSAVSRSSARAVSAGDREWAPDRSPLQKLELTINDISKEEKRARVQEAEMLLREAKARQAGGGAGDVPADRRAVSNPTRAGTKRQRELIKARDDARPQPTIEDSGLVRGLSQTHRDRLQHSTTIESQRPDVRRISGEGKKGFNYSSAEPDYEPSPVAYPSKQNVVQDSRPQASAPTQQPRSVSDQQRALPGQQQQQPRYIDDSDRRPLDRNASHKAALARLTGADGTPQRNGSRKLQKTPPTDVQTSRTRQHIVPAAATPATGTALGAHDRSVPSDETTIPQVLTPPPKIRDPSSTVGGSPPVSSPMSSMRPVGKRQSKSSVTFKEPIFSKRPVDEWKEAKTARLTSADFALDKPQVEPVDKSKTWWEEGGTQQRRRRRSSASFATSTRPGDIIDNSRAEFRPRLFMRCGPLLRYLGAKRIKDEAGQVTGEVWRGSVMIVTQDTHSDYNTPPTLRLWSHPKNLLPPPPEKIGGDLAQEYVDPIAGLTKMSRIGRPLYVRPVDHLQEERDLSTIENDEGLYESSPSLLDTNGHAGKTTALTNDRSTDQDGESVGKYQEVAAARLYADPDRDVTFWRFNIEVELSDVQQHVSYRINRGASSGFWVPARGQSMNIMFHSCNGFSLSVNPNQFSGPDPLWRDVLNVHQTRPFHVMIGGGDQIYNDRCTTETQLFGEWLKIRNPTHKHNAPFTKDMQEELETFYLNRYCMWFSQGLFSMANSQIPMVNIWDDHDIIDGFGSYPDHFMKTPVFSGVGNVAFKYYMLFQHQSVPEETAAHEPSWILGHEPGPYIHQPSRSVFMHMGKEIAFLGIDCRTERMRDEILSIRTFDNLLERCRQEIIEGETKHLLVLLGVPIAYPRLVWLENVLTSRAMDPLKALNRMGVMKTGFLNKFDGGVEILDDLDDHWTASHHKSERNDLITDLQDLAAEKSVRITILGGDVHLAAVGQFRSNPKLKIPKDHDHRYMPNVISSAIVNTPPPDIMADILNKRNKVHTLNKYTEEDMIPMFTHDVDRRKRNNTHLLPRRNWCSIRTYAPGSTPPASPVSTLTPSVNSNEDEIDDFSLDQDREPPKRRFSFTQEPANMFRKLSKRRPPPSAFPQEGIPQRSASYDGSQPAKRGFLGRTFSLTGRRSSVDSQDSISRSQSVDRAPAPVRPGILRRPTNLSEKAARKGNVPAIDAEGNEIDVNDTINLEGGLDVVLNVEVNQKDPAGITTPYRLLVPALWYDGSSDREKLPNTPVVEKKGPLLGRMFSGRSGDNRGAAKQGQGNWGQDHSDSEPYTDDEHTDPQQQRSQQQAQPRRMFGLFGSRRRKQDELYSDEESDIENQPPNGQGAAGFNQPPQAQQQPVQRHSSAPHPPVQVHQQNPAPSRRMQMPETHDALYDTTNQPPSYHTSQRIPIAQAQGAKQISIAPSNNRQVTIGGRQRAASAAAQQTQPQQPQAQQTRQQQHVTMAAPRPTPGTEGLNAHAQQLPPQVPRQHLAQHLAQHGRVASDSYPIQSPPSDDDSTSVSSISDTKPSHQQHANRAKLGTSAPATAAAAPASASIRSAHQHPPPQQHSRNEPLYSSDESDTSDEETASYQPTYPQPVPPQRRQSKQERLLGIGPGGASLPPAVADQVPPMQRGPLRGNGIIGNFSGAGGGGNDRHSANAWANNPHEQQYARQQARGGYSGIEAYKEPKARGRGLSGSFRRARDWLDGGGRRERDYD